MKQNTHPNYHLIKVVMTDKTEYVTRSTYGAEGDTLNLDIDPNTHPSLLRSRSKLLRSNKKGSPAGDFFGPNASPAVKSATPHLARR